MSAETFQHKSPFQCNCLKWGNVEPGSAYHKERDVDEGCYDNLYSPYNQERMKQAQDISTKLFQCNWLQWVVMFNPGATMSRQCIFHEVKTRKSKDISKRRLQWVGRISVTGYTRWQCIARVIKCIFHEGKTRKECRISVTGYNGWQCIARVPQCLRKCMFNQVRK